jgi:acyl carrier protein
MTVRRPISESRTAMTGMLPASTGSSGRRLYGPEVEAAVIDEKSVEPRLRWLVAEQLGVGEEELVADTSLVDDLAADSLDLLELALAIEAEFGFDLSEDALDGVRTYADLAALVADLD